jgi:hypothetical protein
MAGTNDRARWCRLRCRLAWMLVATLLVVWLSPSQIRGHGWHTFPPGDVLAEGTFVPPPSTNRPSALTAKDKFVIAVVTANRPRNASYLASTLHSLYCALDVRTSTAVHQAAAAPSVLLINTEVPASQHLGLAALAGDVRVDHYHQHGLKIVSTETLHSELHTPVFVLEMAKRTVRGYKVRGTAEVRDVRSWWVHLLHSLSILTTCLVWLTQLHRLVAKEAICSLRRTAEAESPNRLYMGFYGAKTAQCPLPSDMSFIVGPGQHTTCLRACVKKVAGPRFDGVLVWRT